VERDFHLLAEELAKALERARDGKGDPSCGRRPRKGNRGGNRTR
jgi:ribonuclease P protein component